MIEVQTVFVLNIFLQVMARSSGIIDCWTHLYRSESVSQVFLFAINWLYNVVTQEIPDEKDWPKVS